MKKIVLILVLICSLLLPSCKNAPSESIEESKGEVVSANSSEMSGNESKDLSFDESISLESSQLSSDSESTTDASEDEVSNAELSEAESSAEESSVQSVESAEDSSEPSSDVQSSESTDTSADLPSIDVSYESFETPVIPVPDSVTAADEDAFFNDSVFVGNSIMLGYENFAKTQRAGSIPDFLGNSKFFCAGSFGVYHNNRTPASQKDAANPSYRGEKYSVEDAVGVMGVKTVYVNFMGLNDLALYYDAKNCARKCADDVIKMIGRINEKYPDVNVVILSATYLTKSTNNMASLNNKNLSLLNNYLLEYCNENGLDFVDIASQLTENGCLADKYASDGYCHIRNAGYRIWTAILRDYAVRKMNGTYQNPERMPVLGRN